MNAIVPLVIYTEPGGGTLAHLDDRPNSRGLFEAAAVLEAAGGKLATIVDEVQAARAVEYRAQANQLVKELDTERLETTEGARKTVERINAKFSAPIDKLKGFVKAIDVALRGYMAAKERKQREEREAIERAAREAQAAAEAEAKALGVEPPPPPPPVVIPPSENPFRLTGSHGAALGQRDNWTWTIVDIKLVPEEYLKTPDERVNRAVLNAKVKSEKDKCSIPGIRVSNEPIIQSRTL